MLQKGTIKQFDRSSRGTGYGKIIPESPIIDYADDVLFFEDGLDQVSFDDLQKGMEVEFILTEWKDNKGELKWLAKQIKRGNVHSLRPIILSKNLSSSSPVKTRTSNKLDFTKLFLEKLDDTLQIVNKVNEPDEFEDCVFYLLRLLGIHDVYQYDRSDQAGKADGFFILQNLAVMYDCTLRNQFEEYKKEQIENYINKLSNKSQLTIDVRKADGGKGSKVLQISGKNRQVWVITRGYTRELYDFDGIKVK